MFSDSEEWRAWAGTTAANISQSVGHVLRDFDRNLHRWPSLNGTINQQAGYNHRLLAYESFKELQYLLQTRHVDPTYHVRGFNALSFTATKSSDEQEACLSLLLQHKVPVNSQAVDRYWYTPLHLLIHGGYKDSAIFFICQAKNLGMGINFSLPDRDGCTSLVLAAKKGLEDVALCILEQSLDPHVFMGFLDGEGKTALYYAQQSQPKQERLVEKLLSLDAQSKTALTSTTVSYTPVFESEKLRVDQEAYLINPSEKADPTQMINIVEHRDLTPKPP